jgi:hypothetical protein
MGLIWLRVLVTPECVSLLYVMLEMSIPVGQLLALQEGSAMGWMTEGKSSTISGRGKVFSHLQSIQTTSGPNQPPVQSVLRVTWLGHAANHLSLSSAMGRMCGAVCSSDKMPFQVMMNDHVVVVCTLSSGTSVTFDRTCILNYALCCCCCFVC